jgi:hypothetical protein
VRLNPCSERGDIVVGWLTRVVLVLAGFGVLAYDAVALGVAKTQVADHASTAALAAADTWARTHDVSQTVAAAVASASSSGDVVLAKDVTIAQDGTVRVKACRTATTLLVYRTSATKKWAVQCGTGQGRSVDS